MLQVLIYIDEIRISGFTFRKATLKTIKWTMAARSKTTIHVDTCMAYVKVVMVDTTAFGAELTSSTP
jgi:hypothetical protein